MIKWTVYSCVPSKLFFVNSNLREKLTDSSRSDPIILIDSNYRLNIVWANRRFYTATCILLNIRSPSRRLNSTNTLNWSGIDRVYFTIWREWVCTGYCQSCSLSCTRRGMRSNHISIWTSACNILITLHRKCFTWASLSVCKNSCMKSLAILTTIQNTYTK